MRDSANFRSQRGASTIEYALILTLIAILAIFGVGRLGNESQVEFQESADALVDPNSVGGGAGEIGGAGGSGSDGGGSNGGGNGGNGGGSPVSGATVALDLTALGYTVQTVGEFTSGVGASADIRDPLRLPWSGEDYLSLNGSANRIFTPVKKSTTESSSQEFEFRLDIDFLNRPSFNLSLIHI